MNIFDAITAKDIAAYYTQLTTNKIPLLGATLFPSKKVLGLDLKWFKGSEGLPVALKPSALDSDAELRDRIGLSSMEADMPFFRESMMLNERDRQELNKLQNSVNAALLEPLFAKIYDDAANLISGADVQLERMRMQLLSTGKIKIATKERVGYNVDYHFNSKNKIILTGADKWSDTVNSNPIEDIQDWIDLVEDLSGNRPTRAICTKKTWRYLMKNEKIRKDLNPIGGMNLIMTDTMLQQYLSGKVGLTVAIYNKKYALSVGGGSEQYFPDDIFTLIPDGIMGNSCYGTTPEESDLMGGQVKGAEVQIVNTGVAVVSKTEYGPPVKLQTTVSAIMMPTFEQIDSVFIAKVA